MDSLRQLLSTVSSQALTFATYLRLGRELKVVEDALVGLNREECRHVNTLVQRHLDRYDAGANLDDAFARVRSPNNTLRLSGIASWLAGAFIETRDANIESLQLRHADIKRAMRVLKLRAEPAAVNKTVEAKQAQGPYDNMRRIA
jgi:hypothetical protein